MVNTVKNPAFMHFYQAHENDETIFCSACITSDSTRKREREQNKKKEMTERKICTKCNKNINQTKTNLLKCKRFSEEKVTQIKLLVKGKTYQNNIIK